MFDTANIVSDLLDAIDATFDRVVGIGNNSSVECRIAEATCFSGQFDSATITTPEGMLVPRPVGAYQYGTAYGRFLAYDVGLLKTNYTNAQYRSTPHDEYGRRPNHHTQYTAWKVNSVNLTNHAFYICVLPLDETTKDTAEIIGRALGVGSGVGGD